MKSQLTINGRVYFWTLSCPTDLSIHRYHTAFITIALYESWNWDDKSLNSVMFQNCFGCSGSFAFPYKSWHQIIIFWGEKNSIWKFDRDCVESAHSIYDGRSAILTVLGLPIHEHGLSLLYFIFLIFSQQWFTVFSIQVLHGLFFFFRDLFLWERTHERGEGAERERIPSRHPAQHEAQHGTWPHDPEIMTRAKKKSDA